jgi:hypothetical protein
MHRWQRKLRVIAKMLFREAQRQNARAFAKLPSGRLRACRGTPLERYVQFQVKWKGPRRIASVESDNVFVVENLLTKELKAAHATRFRFCRNKKPDVGAELA